MPMRHAKCQGIVLLLACLLAAAQAFGQVAGRLPTYGAPGRSQAPIANPFSTAAANGGLPSCPHVCLLVPPGEAGDQTVKDFEEANHCVVDKGGGGQPLPIQSPPPPDNLCQETATPLPGNKTAKEYELDQLKRQDMENEVPYLYLDTVGKVTVGIGTMLPDAAAAEVLPFEKCDKEGRCVPATKEEIDSAFDTISKLPKGKRWTYYEKHTDIRLPESAMERLTMDHLDKDEANLVALFPEYDTYPPRVRAALLDLIYNLGASGLRNKFPKFVAAIKAKDWKTAAAESHRPQVNDFRNSYVSDFLMDAYNDEQKCKKDKPST